MPRMSLPASVDSILSMTGTPNLLRASLTASHTARAESRSHMFSLCAIIRNLCHNRLIRPGMVANTNILELEYYP